MTVWLDIENAPQVQYLSPFRDAFGRAGQDVVVTARNNAFALELLRQRGIEHTVIGEVAGASKARKGVAILRRAYGLRRFVRRRRPQLLVCSSRASPLAAVTLGVPNFAFCDYEFVDLRFARIARTFVVHPDVIPPEVFVERGIARERLVPFAGLKESITFSSVDPAGIPDAPLEGLPPRGAATRVLVRPPAEESHYYREQSKSLTLALLDHLATLEGVAVVLSPRYDWQRRYVEGLRWAVPPVVLDRPVPFVSLLNAVDVVVSSGGTMLREAAFVGKPAYSILRSTIGTVDRHLASTGRIGIISSADEARAIDLERPPLPPLPAATADDLDELARRMLSLAA
jgi:predicted glycosyltransferase